MHITSAFDYEVVQRQIAALRPYDADPKVCMVIAELETEVGLWIDATIPDDTDIIAQY